MYQRTDDITLLFVISTHSCIAEEKKIAAKEIEFVFQIQTEILKNENNVETVILI